MDRPRPTHGGATRPSGGALTRSLVASALVLACTGIITDLERIVAIEIVGSLTPQLAVGDTLQLEARALNAAGDSVPGAVIVWELLDVDSGQVGFTLDTATGQVTGDSPGSGRVVARVETLQSGIITVTVIDTLSGVARAAAWRAGSRPAAGAPPRFSATGGGT